MNELFDAGYAVPLYDIANDTQTFRFRDEEFTLPHGMVTMHEYLTLPVAKIEDVREAVKRQAERAEHGA